MMTDYYIEKRASARTQAYCRLLYAIAGENQAQMREGVCLNISTTGIAFQSAEPVRPGRAVEIRTFPEHYATPPLNAFVEVLRCQPQDREGYQIAGAIKAIKAG